MCACVCVCRDEIPSDQWAAKRPERLSIENDKFYRIDTNAQGFGYATFAHAASAPRKPFKLRSACSGKLGMCMSSSTQVNVVEHLLSRVYLYRCGGIRAMLLTHFASNFDVWNQWLARRMLRISVWPASFLSLSPSPSLFPYASPILTISGNFCQSSTLRHPFCHTTTAKIR